MLLSLLFLGVALVVIGMERQALIYAWRTRPRSLSEGEGCAVTYPGQFAASGFSTSNEEEKTEVLPLSESDCGYDSVLPDRIVTRHGAVVSLADHDEALL